MAGRYLISIYLTEDINNLYADDNGKLHIRNSELNLSLSHSDELIALQFSKLPVGVDVQKGTPRIANVASKFCNESEYKLLAPYYTKVQSEHILWGLKECVYKAFGQGKVNYKKEIILQEIFDDDPHRLRILLNAKNGRSYQYAGRTRLIGDYYINQVRILE